jgi:heme-degrading monooxygenase HmoA
MSDIYEGIDGFAQFGIADVGDGDFLSMTVWDSREAAEKANEAARSWVSENVSDRIELKTSMIGDFGYLKA